MLTHPAQGEDARNEIASAHSDSDLGVAQLAQCIDHTLLKADASTTQVEKLCTEAIAYNFASVCVHSARVPNAVRILKGSQVKITSVVGFPLGASSSTAKASEASEAVRCGADELDMVIQLGALKEGDFRFVLEDISQVIQAAAGRPVKVILEVGILSETEKIVGCVLAKAAGAAFVKTSTGFLGESGKAANPTDIRLMRTVVGHQMGVKASGGIRTYEQAVELIEAGANRLGLSATVAIIEAARQEMLRRRKHAEKA